MVMVAISDTVWVTSASGAVEHAVSDESKGQCLAVSL